MKQGFVEDGLDQESNARVSSGKKSSSLAAVVKIMKRWWIVIVILLIIVTGLITWRVIVMNENTAWTKAKDYFSRADYDNAKKSIGDMAVPSDSERLRVYAQTMLATRDLDKALIAYKKLYELNKDISVKLFIGNIYNEQKRYDEAIKIYKEMIAANPNNIQAYVNASTTYKLQSNRSGSIDIAKEGVRNNPTNVIMHELLVSMLMDDRTSSDYIAALAALKELSPQDSLVRALEL
jgi:tetratricopeptide (TPR) repeat protein